MTSYELRWYYWLRRELKAELGVPVPTGRPRSLTPEQELRVFREVIATPRKRRALVLMRLSAETGAAYSTLQAVVTNQVAAHGGSSLRTFHVEPENSLLSTMGEQCA